MVLDHLEDDVPVMSAQHEVIMHEGVRGTQKSARLVGVDTMTTWRASWSSHISNVPC